MNSTATASNARTGAARAAPPPIGAFFGMDPLDADDPADEPVLTTARAISRVALVASETASRFQREGVEHDPMTWMMAPRALFGGATALSACLAREDCVRGVLLHGLSLGLDAKRSDIDDLLEGGEDAVDFGDVVFEEDEGAWLRRGDGAGRTRPLAMDGGPTATAPPTPDPRGDLRLFTATLVACDGIEVVQAFHASLATEEAEVAGRLYARIGAAMADAVIVDGFDPTEPLVAALVAPALRDTLALIEADPSSPLAAGLDLNVEQRFLA